MRFLPLIVTAMISATAHAAVYRWVDQAGNVRYGDRPPSQGAEVLKTPPPAPVQATARPTPAPTPRPDIYTGTHGEICEELKANLSRYHASAHMALPGPDGQPRLISPAEREDLINRTRAQALEACARAAEDDRSSPGLAVQN